MAQSQRLIDYFSIVGLGDKLTPHDLESYHERRSVTNVDIFYGYGGNKIDFMGNKDEKWIDLDGSKTVWLKVTFNQKSPAITSIDFVQLPVEKRRLKIDAKMNIYPVPLKRLIDDNSEPKFEGMDDEFAYYSGNYDLTEILGFDKKMGFNTALCYKTQNKKNYEVPLEDISVFLGEKKKDSSGAFRTHVNLAKNYEIIKKHYGRTDKDIRFLSFKRGPSLIENKYASHVIDRYPREATKGTEAASDAISMFCFPKGILLSRTMRDPCAFSFILTKEDGARTYGTTIVFDEDFPPELYDQLGHIEVDNNNPLYTQKAICVISHYAFFEEYREALKQIYRLHLAKNDLPIERVICNLIDETQVPDKGKTAVLVDFGQPILFQRPSNYPLCSDLAIKNLFTVLSYNKVINLVECVLLERKILLISKYRSLLTDVAQAITSLIFPFQWTQVLIPILPEHLRSYIEAPVPYVIGLYLAENEDIEFTANDIVKVYLDTAELIYSDNIPPLPEKHFKRLVKRLEVFGYLHDNYKTKLEGCDSAFDMKIIDPDDAYNDSFNPYEIRDAFFQFMTSTLKRYNKYFSPPKEKKDDFIELKDLFHVNEFLTANKANKQGTFLSKLVETGLFTYFIETRAFSNNKFEAEYKFLDQSIKKKRTKKEPRLIVKPHPEKTMKAYSPNETGLQKGQVFHYRIFPKLNSLYFVQARPMEKLIADEAPTRNPQIEAEQLALMEDSKWAKFLLETMYTLWFLVFNIKLKTEFKDYYSKVTEYANILFENIRIKGITPNEIVYRSLIEACGYCGMNDRALEIVTKLKDSRTEISPFAHGVYLEAISRAREFKYEKSRLEKTEETKETEGAQGNDVDKCVIFVLSTTCRNCNETLFAEDIMSGWKRSYHDYTTRCPLCLTNFTPEIRLIQQSGTFQFETQFYMLSPLVVKKELQNLIKIKGIDALFMDKFETEHKHVYWNIYLQASIIQAPTFFLERHLSPSQIAEHLKALETQVHAYQMGKVYKAKTLFGPLKMSKISSAPRKGTGTDSGISDGKGEEKSKHSEGDVSQQGSKSSINVNMNKAKDTNANFYVKRVFGDLLDELRESLEKKLIDYELDIKLKKEDEESQLDVISDEAEDINEEHHKSDPEVNVVNPSQEHVE